MIRLKSYSQCAGAAYAVVAREPMPGMEKVRLQMLREGDYAA
jgi:hypothetical protein